MTVPERLRRVAVIGNGIMGHGISQVFATAGKDVVMIGHNEASLRAALERVRESLQLFERHGLVSQKESQAALARVSTSTAMADAAGAELVVEAVPEDTELKLSTFGELDHLCPPPAVLASSSGRPASSLVDRVRHQERVIAAHFWNPAQLLPLVEVCAGPETSAEVTDWIVARLREAGKAPVVVGKEIDGFIGNRLQFALLREALALWSEGVASAEAIDTAVKASFGRRLSVTGPLESAQLGGLQTMYEFSRFLFPSLDTTKEPPRKMLDGLYAWPEGAGESLRGARYEELFRQLAADRPRVGQGS
ncbi:MAG TPA: 3-hydroxyacyl-CoA dehydrogenase family protein [Gaiellales bacterium]|nr:3-hydroxyacyl-CoA dehydrogenase family protein [Gaiellales bacterium]